MGMMQRIFIRIRRLDGIVIVMVCRRSYVMYFKVDVVFDICVAFYLYTSSFVGS